MNISWTSK